VASNYVPEVLKKALYLESQKPLEPPETLLTTLHQAVGPRYQRLISHLSALLPAATSESTPPADDFLSRTTTQLHNILFKLQQAEPTILAASVLALILLFRLSMSWSSRLPSWGGRFSPFGRSPNANGEVSDADFSYITSDDLARQQAEQSASARKSRDTDVLVLKHKRVSYPVHFPAHSIDRGELTIGNIRAAAARKLNAPASEAHRIKILYKGRNLNNDAKSALSEGLHSDFEHELMLVYNDAPAGKGGESSSEGEEEDETVDEGRKKTRRRKKSKKSKKSKTTGIDTPPSYSNFSNLNPDATFAPAAAPPPRRPITPQPQAQLSPIQKLDALASIFHTKFVPDCVQFTASPPSDKAKREFDHKKLTETILGQILLKLDAVETEGDPTARQRRKDIVKEVQGMLNRLDEVVKG
jgi:hypothetical protein